MLSHYYKTGLRNLLRNRTHFFVNITGLAIGFSAFLLIFMVLAYEQSFDNFHPKKDRIYRAVRISNNPGDGEYRTGVPFPVTSALREEMPQIAAAAAITAEYDVQVIVPGPDGSAIKKYKEAKGVFLAEPQFFHLFNFPLAEGDVNTALKEPNTLLLTKALATKYFGGWQTAVGKTLNVHGLAMRITGILENPPVNTDFPLGMVFSYASLNADMNDWGSITDVNYCFIQLRPGYTPAQIDALMPAFMSRHIKADQRGYDLHLQSLEDMHADKRFGNFSGRTFSKDLVTALRLIGFFLLVVACVNFINLSTANAINRAREIGVRKALGSNRGQLLLQFFGETGITCLLAMTGAIIISLACIPFLNSLLDIKLSLNILKDPAAILFMLAALAGVTLLSGFYPALILSGFNPVSALKGKITTSAGKGVSLRRALVVLQFVIAQVLIIGTLVVISQMNYFRNKDLGFSKAAIVTASIPHDSLNRTKFILLQNELLAAPGVEGLSFSSFVPMGDGGWATDIRLTENTNMVVNMKPADTAYAKLYNMQLLAGRMYFSSDTMREYVVNETLLRKTGLGSPEAAVGKIVTVAGRRGPIVGVVKDFHNHSLRDPIDPIVMTAANQMYGLTNIKIAPGKAKQALAAMAAIWNKLYPDYVFEYNFLDQSIANYYKQEDQLSQLFKVFAGLAIFISCLGLYGMVSFMAGRRKKEIGIRKVLGAPVSSIVVLLSREFTILIAVAFCIAAPLAWYFMGEWLQQYTFSIRLGAGFFVVTLLSSVIIAWVTVGHSAIKAAIANPVKSLRTE
ncbi:ABC transporter permease [Chitinophaga agrisoli]|nr:ABC transporter permease [Chitinophaga agrisoli]